jgi:probable HAF family extracellular repeat protein
MFSDHKKRVTLITRYFMFPLLIIATGAWGQTYTAADLGNIDPFTVGSTGQAVGIIQNSNDYEQPFITVDGNIKALDALHSDDTARAVAINSSGVAVGYSCLSSNPECSAVTWVAGGIPTVFAEGFYPKAINDAGEIVGSLYQSNSSGITSPSGLAVWQKGVFSPLPWLSQPQGGSAGALPNAINSAGVVAGELYLIGADNGITGYAVVWNGSQIQNLGANAAAKGINDHGQVVGFSGNDAALWTNGALTDLGNLEGGFTVANAINNSGVIVGTADLSLNSAAVVWIGGTLYQLIDLIKPALPHNIQLEYGQAINDAGQIVA